jgi:hypothetical protein
MPSSADLIFFGPRTNGNRLVHLASDPTTNLALRDVVIATSGANQRYVDGWSI